MVAGGGKKKVIIQRRGERKGRCVRGPRVGEEGNLIHGRGEKIQLSTKRKERGGREKEEKDVLSI